MAKQRPKRIQEQKAPYKARAGSTVQRKTSHRLPDAVHLDPEWSRAEWEWVDKNRARLEKEYPGRWIAVAGGRVVGSGRRLEAALKQAKIQGVNHPFVTAFRPLKYQGKIQVAQWL